MDNELKPCPFCGGRAIIVPTLLILNESGGPCWTAGCTDSDCISYWKLQEKQPKQTRGEAVSAWNRRAGNERL